MIFSSVASGVQNERERAAGLPEDIGAQRRHFGSHRGEPATGQDGRLYLTLSAPSDKPDRSRYETLQLVIGFCSLVSAAQPCVLLRMDEAGLSHALFRMVEAGLSHVLFRMDEAGLSHVLLSIDEAGLSLDLIDRNLSTFYLHHRIFNNFSNSICLNLALNAYFLDHTMQS